MAKHDINDTGNNTDFNLGSRDRASAREIAGMNELARPSGLGRESTTGNGHWRQDNNFVATNDDQGGPRTNGTGE
jgi:hypothetical protein